MATQTKIPPLTVSNPWWGHDPSDKQLEALWVYEQCPDLFYGGAAGPGKTSYLLMAAVQYVQHPHYRALILRKTYADLSLPDAIMDRAISWWDGVEGARFSHADKTCYFPSGARVQFGYMASARDHLRYQGAAVHFVGIDEASQIPSRADPPNEGPKSSFQTGPVKGGEKVYHCGGGIVYHRHDEKGLNWEPGGIRSGAGVRSSGVSQESTGSSDTWEAALCRLCLRR